MPDPTPNGAPHSTALRLKTGLAEMLKGGVIMDVVDAGAGASSPKKPGRRR